DPGEEDRAAADGTVDAAGGDCFRGSPDGGHGEKLCGDGDRIGRRAEVRLRDDVADAVLDDVGVAQRPVGAGETPRGSGSDNTSGGGGGRGEWAHRAAAIDGQGDRGR